MAKNLKPGTDNAPAGEYELTGTRGGVVKGGRTVRIDKGDRLPPTPKKGQTWTKK